jgi:cytosine/adenosine deaminase-related metal-dependent hydrolase
MEDLLHLAELARERKAYVEARVYLKTAMMREVTRPEPHYWLGHISELEGDKRRAMQYYSLALVWCPRSSFKNLNPASKVK